MKISKEDIKQYEEAIKHWFPRNSAQPLALTHARLNLTTLDINTYIYIHDNYEKLKGG